MIQSREQSNQPAARNELVKERDQAKPWRIISGSDQMSRPNSNCVILSLCFLITVLLQVVACQLQNFNSSSFGSLRDRLGAGQPRRRQSQATFLSHKQNLITGSANTPLSSPYNQFYLTNNVNSPHNGNNLTPRPTLVPHPAPSSLLTCARVPI